MSFDDEMWAYPRDPPPRLTPISPTPARRCRQWNDWAFALFAVVGLAVLLWFGFKTQTIVARWYIQRMVKAECLK